MSITNLPESFFEELTTKLINVGIPEDISKKYSGIYKRGLSPEIEFENHIIPDDDHFETLRRIYPVFYEGKEIREFDIKQILNISYRDVEKAKSKMKEYFDSDDVELLYLNDEEVYRIGAYEVEYIYGLVDDIIKDKSKQWEVFKRAVPVGMFITETRFEAVKSAVCEDTLEEVIYFTTVNGFLLYSYYNDPEKAIDFLKERFDKETIRKILVENEDFLYLFKEEYYGWRFGEKEKTTKRIQEILLSYDRK